MIPLGRNTQQVKSVKRYEKQVPGHHVQVDIKFLTFKDKSGRKVRRFQYTAIDDATRIRALKVYEKHNQVERSHLTDKIEFYQLLNYKGDVDLEAKLAEWEAFYNYHRPHGNTPRT